jgi:fatty-acyl-CoA synthase
LSYGFNLVDTTDDNGAARFWANVTTVGDLLDRRAEECPHADMVVFPNERLTYAEMSNRAQYYARSLVGLGVEPGDRVGLLLANNADMLALLFAVTKIGAIATPVNTRFKVLELRHIISQSGMSLLFVGVPEPAAPDFVELLGEAFPELTESTSGELTLSGAPELKRVILLGDVSSSTMIAKDEFLRAGVSVDDETIYRRQASVRVRDAAILVYTSGTTSLPKGAILCHEALVRLADGIAHTRLMMTPEDRMWTAIPFFHGGGITHMLTCVSAGAALVHAGFFVSEDTPAYLERERVSVAIAAFETIWLPVLNHPDFAQYDLHRLRAVVIVGVPERLRSMAKRLPQAIHISTVAMTESAAFLSLGKLDDPLDARLDTGGPLMPGMECRIVDPDTGLDLEAGTPGELLFRGPSAFDGYFRSPELTAKVIDEHGWVRSGDVVIQDAAGRLTFVSRLKDMLKVGGENVAAAELEGYLLSHPAVDIVQVVGAPDAYYGEVPAAYVQLKPGATATEEGLIEFCLGKVATYRVPRYVRFVTEWPMSGTKIKKVDLREEIAAELKARGIVEAPRMKPKVMK